MLRIELAPMEGITSYIYRNALCKYYGGVDTYFSPFISTHKDKRLNFKEKKEIKPENNIGYKLIPQVLTSDADEFLFTAGQIAEYGYEHININFGCPSATVTTKGKGSGALVDIDKLDRLLDSIFTKTTLKISVKTRLGYADCSEWETILRVYEKYPIEELIVHARVREDFYNGKAKMEFLAESAKGTHLDISYNGDIYSRKDYEHLLECMPDAFACMIGRGIISNPALAKNISEAYVNGESDASISSDYSVAGDLGVFKSFNHELIDGYDAIMPGEKNTLFKLKELWTYMITSFDNDKRLLKSIKKCNSLKEYQRIIDSL